MAIEFAPSARVLLAEGNRFHSHLVTRALHDVGYEVHAVGTQAEAEAIGTRGFDLVLVGDQLEDGAGIDFVRAITCLPNAPPVIVLVDPEEPIEAAVALAAGAVDQVVKSPDLATPLRLAMSRALERQRMLGKIEELERRLELTTRVDPISGVYTDRYFQDVLTRELARIHRFGGSMALIKLEGASSGAIEKTIGAHVRDRIMREVGAMLQADLRATDLAGSWPDGHFLVALTGTDRTGAETVASRLSRKLAHLETALGLSPGLMPQPEVLGAGGYDDVSRFAES